MAVADFQRPGEASALHVTGAAQRHRRVGRLARRWKEDFRIHRLTYASDPPGQVPFPFLNGPQQSRVPTSGCHLMWARHPSPGQAPHLPRGLLPGMRPGKSYWYSSQAPPKRNRQAPAARAYPRRMPALCCTALRPCQTRVPLTSRQNAREETDRSDPNDGADAGTCRSEQCGRTIHSRQIQIGHADPADQFWSIFAYVPHRGGNRTYLDTGAVLR